MSLEFDKYAAKGHEFVKLVADELNISPEKAGRITRAFFHALRNRISHEESFQLLAQLPMAIKGVYVDGWKFDKDYRRINNVIDFLDEVRKEDGNTAGYDFGNDTKAAAAVLAVLKAMHYYVSDGELKDIIGMLPLGLQNIFQKSLEGDALIM